MFDIYHKLTEEEAQITQELFDARSELKALNNAKLILQKDFEIMADDDQGNVAGLFLAFLPVVFFWSCFLGDIVLGFLFSQIPLSLSIAFASASPVFAIASTIFFINVHSRHLMIYSKKEKYMKKAKKENVQNKHAYYLSLKRKYAEVTTRIKDTEALIEVLSSKLERMELESSSNEEKK